jgi:hypothetical protein
MFKKVFFITAIITVFLLKLMRETVHPHACGEHIRSYSLDILFNFQGANSHQKS